MTLILLRLSPAAIENRALAELFSPHFSSSSKHANIPDTDADVRFHNGLDVHGEVDLGAFRAAAEQALAITSTDDALCFAWSIIEVEATEEVPGEPEPDPAPVVEAAPEPEPEVEVEITLPPTAFCIRVEGPEPRDACALATSIAGALTGFATFHEPPMSWDGNARLIHGETHDVASVFFVATGSYLGGLRVSITGAAAPGSGTSAEAAQVASALAAEQAAAAEAQETATHNPLVGGGAAPITVVDKAPKAANEPQGGGRGRKKVQ